MKKFFVVILLIVLVGCSKYRVSQSVVVWNREGDKRSKNTYEIITFIHEGKSTLFRRHVHIPQGKIKDLVKVMKSHRWCAEELIRELEK